MAAAPPSRWIKFIRNYGPIPTNDNMYDETIQRALGRLKIEPLVLPAQFLDQVLTNLRSSNPCSEILTGTAGDGKTYHCREVWTALGGSETEWNRGGKVQKLSVDGRDLIVIKDLSELRAEESAEPLSNMASDVADPIATRFYLIAANHGQLLEKKGDATEPADAALGELDRRALDHRREPGCRNQAQAKRPQPGARFPNDQHNH